MDDFQFKPLTDGLGFHRKSPIPNAPTAKPANKSKLAELDATLSKISDELSGLGHVELTSPLPRVQQEPRKNTELVQTPQNPTVDEILKTLHDKRKAEFGSHSFINNRVGTEPGPINYKPATWEFSASLLDLMLILAINLLCLISLLLVTKVDLFGNLSNPDSQGLIYVSLASLFAGITWIYLVATRLFLGFTAGEWVFDQRLGTPEELSKASYGIKVAIRSLVMLVTGFAIFPVISALLNRDILGRWMGLELVKKV